MAFIRKLSVSTVKHHFRMQYLQSSQTLRMQSYALLHLQKSCVSVSYSSHNHCNVIREGSFSNIPKISTVTHHRRDYEHDRRNNAGTNGWKKFGSLSAILGVLGYYYVQNVCCAELLHSDEDFQQKIDKARDIIIRIKDEHCCPGIVVAVSVDGKNAWSEGHGFSNLEQRVPCTPDTVMRIASISKPITMTIMARLMEMGKVDLDKPVSDYVKYWPDKVFQGEKVTITVRHLLSHLSGIRHYDKNCGRPDKTKENKNDSGKKDDVKKQEDSAKISMDKSTFTEREYLMKKRFNNTRSSVDLFKDDELCFKPGSTFLYTTHGFTLIASVIEAVTDLKFSVLLKRLFVKLGLQNTYLDEAEPLIYNRASQYMKNKSGQIVNAPYVDLSYKWAGGGLVSTVGDIVKFGNIMLYSAQYNTQTNSGSSQSYNYSSDNNASAKSDIFYKIKTDMETNATKPQQQFTQICAGNPQSGYLQPETMAMLWKPISQSPNSWDGKSGWYGMGWELSPEVDNHGNYSRARPFSVCHTGGAVGGSSVLTIMPKGPGYSGEAEGGIPRGVVVSIIVNMQSVGLKAASEEIAQIFSL